MLCMKLVADEVFGPCAFLEKYRAEDNLDKLNQMNGEEEREDGHGGIAGKNESYGIADAPDVYAVKHEGEHRLSACAEGEVGGVNEAVEGHHCGAYQQITIAMNISLLSSSFARSMSPEPSRWPTMMEIALAKAKTAQKKRLDTVELMLEAEIASRPRRE